MCADVTRMNRVVFVLVTILCLLSLSSIRGLIHSAKADSGTITINADGSITGTTSIQTADNMTYVLTSDINSSVSGNDEAITVLRDNITIDGNGFTLQNAFGSGGGTGLDLSGTTNVTVRNITVTGFDWGISVSSFSSIDGNDITNNARGIWLDAYSGTIESSSNSISGNNIADNGYGIFGFSFAHNNNITGNNFTADTSGGVRFGSDSNNSISGNRFIDCGLSEIQASNSVVNNTVNGKPLVYLEDVVGYTMGDAGQVILVGCDDITVEGLNLSNATIGAELYGTSNSTISHNIFTANSVSDIDLSDSSNDRISGNNMTTNSGDCISLNSSHSNNIYGNNISNSYDGIDVGDSSNNNIYGNNLTTNSGDCISLDSSYSNNIYGNNISNSYNGIYLEGSSNNSIYHNNFVNNTLQVYVAPPINFQDMYVAPSVGNVWDDGYPSGGNHWSDYNGTDHYSGQYQNITGSDGIGDTPYIIDANNTDNYPLMAQYTVPEFPTFLILPLFLIATLLAVIIYKKKAIPHKRL